MTGSISGVAGRPNYWLLRVYLGRDPATDKERYIRRGFKGTRKAAERALAKLVVEVDEKPESARPPTDATINALLDRYLDHLAVNDRSPTTLAGYRSNARRVREELGSLTLNDVVKNPGVIDDFIAGILRDGRSPATAMRHYRLLSGAFKQAVRWRWIPSSPMAATTPPPERKPVLNPPDAEQVFTLLDLASAKSTALALLIELGAMTGMRRGEVAGMRWSDLDGTTLTISRVIVEANGEVMMRPFTKNKRPRTIHLTMGTMALLDKWRAECLELAEFAGVEMSPDAYVLSTSPDGAEPWNPDRITDAWRRLRRQAGVKGRYHDLRHWHASEMIDMGESLIAVAARLGHDPTTTVKTYAHLLRPDKRVADALDERRAQRNDSNRARRSGD